jgi:hypothetical protein
VPFNFLSNGYLEALSPGVWLPEREADHSPPANDEANNKWSFNSTALCTFVACATINLPFLNYVEKLSCKMIGERI